MQMNYLMDLVSTRMWKAILTRVTGLTVPSMAKVTNFHSHTYLLILTIIFIPIQGTWTYANGDQYVGDWANGHKHGYGIWTLKNGDRYEGHFFNDARNGKGTYYFATGDLYVGDYVDDIKEGFGEYTAKVTTPCKDVATSGKYRYFDGDHYIGQYHKNNRHGIGNHWSKYVNLYEG